MKYLIGIDVGGTKIAYGLFNENRKLISRDRRCSDQTLEPNDFFDLVISDVRHLLENNELAMTDISGIGIGLPSYVNFEKGYIVKTGSLPKICNFPLREYLQKAFGSDIKIVIDNDAHSGALAEYRHGVGNQFKHIVYCPVSTGISSAIIINGEIFRGSYGWAGESGHMLSASPADEVICGCGNAGCYNSLCSGKMIVNTISKWIGEGAPTIMTELAGGADRITAEHINAAYEAGDPLAIRAIDFMAQYLSIWLYNIYTILNINCFVFSGGLLSMGDKLFGQIKKQFSEYNKNDFPVYFYEAKLGSDSGIIGAIELLF